jgi:hypothetical protein
MMVEKVQSNGRAKLLRIAFDDWVAGAAYLPA